MNELTLNPERAAERITRFIAERKSAWEKEGLLLGLSGGLDSTVTAALCVHAVGRESAAALTMPEKEGPKNELDDCRYVADWLGIELKVKDITDVLQAAGAYDFIVSKIPTRRLRREAIKAGHRYFVGTKGLDPLTDKAAGRNRLIAGAAAQIRIKHRMRMALLYFEADSRNLLVAGAANKTERMTGLFCRFGIDDNADIMPICHLYRTQELRLAEYLGVPERIRAKTPEPGIIPGVTDKYVFFTGMSSEKLDRILAAFESGMQPGEIAAERGIELEKVNYVGQLLSYSEKMRQVPAAPEESPH